MLFIANKQFIIQESYPTIQEAVYQYNL